MTVFSKAVPGFNHNIKHKGKSYHIQTEDSGVDNPRITTHLFVGGTVIASKKTSYADIVNADNLSEVVRELMEEQHKEMLRSLLSGSLDKQDNKPFFEPGQLALDAKPPTFAPLQPPVPGPVGQYAALAQQSPAQQPTAQTASAQGTATSQAAQAIQQSIQPPQAAPATVVHPQAQTHIQPPPVPQPAPTASPPPPILNPHPVPQILPQAQPRQAPQVFQPVPLQEPLPFRSPTAPIQPIQLRQLAPNQPPPIQLQPAGSRQQQLQPGQQPNHSQLSKAGIAKPASGLRPPSIPAAPVVGSTIGSQSARQSQLGAAAQPQPQPKASPSSLFGEDLISEKSLDEVILAYLAGDNER